MTRDVIARFAESDSGKTYLAVCDRFRVDPGSALDDDVLAYQLRAALMLASIPAPDPLDKMRADQDIIRRLERGEL